MPISQDFIYELKARNSIEDVVSSYVNRRRAGRNQTGLCPFHNEKTPSFTVFPESGSFYCFGCQAAGDVITFIRRIENLDYINAVKFLADRAGMTMPEDGQSDASYMLRTKILEINRAAAKFFHNNLARPEGRRALDYLRGRGLTDATIRKFGLGAALDSWDSLIKHLREKGYSRGDIIAANLAVGKNERYYDRFRNRVMFPIIDLRGAVVGFTGRILDKDNQRGKYVNTENNVVYKKNREIYGLNFAKNSNGGRIILCEGNMDVIAMNQAGFENAVAAMGTAFNHEHARILSKYCEEIIIAGDNDEAGRRAVMKETDVLRDAGLKVKILEVPSGKDPDEFLRENGEKGRELFADLLKNAVTDVDYKLRITNGDIDMTSAEGRVEYSKKAIAVLCDIDNRLEREIYAAKLAQQLEISKESVMQQIEQMKKRRRRADAKKQFREIGLRIGGYSDKINPEKVKFLRASRSEEQLISLLINNSDYLKSMKEKGLPDLFLTSFNRRLFSEAASSIESGYTEPEDILADLNRCFEPEEISAAHSIAMLRSGEGMGKGNGDIEEIDDFCQILRQEREKVSAVTAASMSEQEAAEAFERLKRSKLE
ncbi:MAG: DNA primase [Clostridia bacterium]|nr:DNA primase [Clostridia bacterium]